MGKNFLSDITSSAFIKVGATSNDVLLGDGTTTSLSGLGGGLPSIYTANTGTIINMGYDGNFCNNLSANTATSYTLTELKTGGWAKVFINAASEPSFPVGVIKDLNGSAFVANTDMYLMIYYNGTTSRYYFQTLTASSGGGITSLNGLTGSSQAFVNDTNVTITSSGSNHTLGWSGTLADGRIASASTWNAKQAALVSGTNIKTVNGNSLLGSTPIVLKEENIIGSALINLTATGTVATLDFNVHVHGYYNLTGAMILNVTAPTLAVGDTVTRTIEIKANGFATTLPTSITDSMVGTYDSAKRNFLAITYVQIDASTLIRFANLSVK